MREYVLVGLHYGCFFLSFFDFEREKGNFSMHRALEGKPKLKESSPVLLFIHFLVSDILRKGRRQGWFGGGARNTGYTFFFSKGGEDKAVE